MLTEEEAKEKWCPYAMVVVPDKDCKILIGAPVFNRSYVTEEVTNISPAGLCIASACMAWRWVEGGGPGPQHPDGPERIMEGYCGLAGKP